MTPAAPGTSRPVESPLAWAPTAHYRRLATVALLPLLALLLTGRPGYLVLAAPVVAGLAAAARRPRYGAKVSVAASAERCFEGEQVTIAVTAEADGPADSVRVRAALPPGLVISDAVAARAQGGGLVRAQWLVTARRWGRWDTGQIVVTVRSRGGLYAGTARLSTAALSVFPRPPALTQLALPADLHTRIGDHVDRRPGEGVEFAGVRPLSPGDRPRRINWPVTTRRGALHVNQLAAERAAEIVAVIDALTDTGPPGDSTLDRAVRGAAGIARAYTRAGDRVGVITLYGPLRWIDPGIGERQFFRIAESVLEARSLYSFVSPDLDRIPPAVLPSGALVIFLSPLLDDRAVEAVMDLRERGYAVIVADVLSSAPAPAPGPAGSLALRTWRLERRAQRYRLESAGIPVVGWPGEPPGPAAAADAGGSLDAALARFSRVRVRGGIR